MSAYRHVFRRSALIVSGTYGLIALFFLLVSEHLADYQLLVVYDKVLIYLLTPLLLLLVCRVEAVMGATMAIRLGSRSWALMVRLILHAMCAVFCAVFWLALTNLFAVLRYRTPLLLPGDAGVLIILCYIPLWLLLAEMSILIGKFLPSGTAALSCAAGYFVFAVELLSVSVLLPPQLGLLFSWFYRKTGTVALCLWCVILAAILARVCKREDMLI